MSQLLHHRLNADLSSIGQILRDPLEVPEYQRSYSWELPQVEAFWHDLLAAVRSRQPIYFLGTVVISTPTYGERGIVIDGQQRLATGTMLLATVKRIYENRGEAARGKAFANKYLSAPSLATGEDEPKLCLNRRDRDFFTGYVIYGKESKIQSSSNENIKNAFDFLHNELVAEVDAAGPHWEEYLEQWVEFLDGRAAVVSVKVDDDADAFLVFETLNDRGLELTIADVIKNYLFGLSRDEIDEAERAWIAAQESLEAFDVGDMTHFLRQWWSSREGATRERELYTRVRENVRSAASARATLRELEEAAPRYAATYSADHPRWLDHGAEAPRAIDVLLWLNLEQYRPLLMAAMGNLPPEAIASLTSGLVCWSLRGLVVGGIGGGKTERIYADAAHFVTRMGEEASLEAIEELLRPAIPSDAEFHEAFASRSVRRRPMAKYILAALDQAETGERTPHLVDLDEYSDRVVVPIVPHSATSDDGWDESFFVAGELRLSTHRLGNLLLLDRSEASVLSSEPAERLEQLASHILLNGSFNAQAVESRQLHMAQLAGEVWSVARH